MTSKKQGLQDQSSDQQSPIEENQEIDLYTQLRSIPPKFNKPRNYRNKRKSRAIFKMDQIMEMINQNSDATCVLIGPDFKNIQAFKEYENEQIKNINHELFILIQEYFAKDNEMKCTITVIVGDITQNTYETTVQIEMNIIKSEHILRRTADIQITTGSYNRACNYGYLMVFKEVALNFLKEQVQERSYLKLPQFAQNLYQYIATANDCKRGGKFAEPKEKNYTPFVLPIHQAINQKIKQAKENGQDKKTSEKPDKIQK